MLVAERHIIKKGHRFWAEIDNLSWQSKNQLFNPTKLDLWSWLFDL
jgi:hypothetical protein